MASRRVLCCAILCALLLAPLSFSAQDKPSSFTTPVASQLLAQVREGLEGRSQKKILAAFDLSQMTNGPLFRQQIAGLFNQTESVRVHLNLVEIEAGDAGRQRVAVEAEMEADPRGNGLPVHKRARLTFIAERSAHGWKFTGVEPRSFFSLQP